ncbi:DNA-3-methyladenine glycosylase 2 family protein [Streptomyces durbertensis]|uniref:DNA-3-methyladenine glycosylase 2 family protein n=1 Tax=Streptomyces durbertensis TaxID=2448886 RepID=A0ABR6EEV6_9ACTN|nr:DNA-3-methyladenine glycosylase 2 family protein [Streptomyces durbertensis]MBB1243617.1 DNA-3-methyladenine glycosylase 2 family protein [Streptomyces durbertensis]
MPAVRSWTPPGPYDLHRSLRVLQRGPGDPAQRRHDGALWRTSRNPDGPFTLRLTENPPGRIEAQAWGPGRDRALDGLPALLGADDRPEDFVPRHALVHAAHRRNPGLRLVRTGLVLESLIPSILEQKVTTDEAYRAWRLLLRRHGEPAPGPTELMPGGMYVMPDATGWRRVPSWEWHRAGVDDKRAATVLRACRVAARLEEAAAMPSDEASRRLRLVPGIGPWTAAETLQRSNGDPDAVTVGDYHLPNIVGYALTGRRGLDDAAMLELLDPYAGQRHRATRLILLAGRVPERRGPRFPVGDIARL